MSVASGAKRWSSNGVGRVDDISVSVSCIYLTTSNDGLPRLHCVRLIVMLSWVSYVHAVEACVALLRGGSSRVSLLPEEANIFSPLVL